MNFKELSTTLECFHLAGWMHSGGSIDPWAPIHPSIHPSIAGRRHHRRKYGVKNTPLFPNIKFFTHFNISFRLITFFFLRPPNDAGNAGNAGVFLFLFLSSYFFFD